IRRPPRSISWKRTAFFLTAGYRRTGMTTSPNESDPVHRAAGMSLRMYAATGQTHVWWPFRGSERARRGGAPVRRRVREVRAGLAVGAVRFPHRWGRRDPRREPQRPVWRVLARADRS